MKKLIFIFLILIMCSCNNQICGTLISTAQINDEYYLTLDIDNDTISVKVDEKEYSNIGMFDYNLPYCISKRTIINNIK